MTRAQKKPQPTPVTRPISCPPIDNMEALVRALHSPRPGAKVRVLTVLATDPFAASQLYARLAVYVGHGESADDFEGPSDPTTEGTPIHLDEDGSLRLHGFSTGDVLARATEFLRQCVLSKLEVLREAEALTTLPEA